MADVVYVVLPIFSIDPTELLKQRFWGHFASYLSESNAKKPTDSWGARRSQEVIWSWTFLHGSRGWYHKFPKFWVVPTATDQGSFLMFVLPTRLRVCVFACASFFWCWPSSGCVFFRLLVDSCIRYIRTSERLGFPSLWPRPVLPRWENEKMHEKLACIARVFCRQICREAVCSLTTDFGDHWCIYVYIIWLLLVSPFAGSLLRACRGWGSQWLLRTGLQRVLLFPHVSAPFSIVLKNWPRGVWFFNVYPFSCF